MNASIHNYSLSICCSPRCLVVVFYFFFSAKKKEKEKAIKAGQKQARAQTVYLEKEKKESAWECVWGSDSSVGVHIVSVLFLRKASQIYLNIHA